MMQDRNDRADSRFALEVLLRLDMEAFNAQYSLGLRPCQTLANLFASFSAFSKVTAGKLSGDAKSVVLLL
jgi:hypothetical protein